MYDRYHPHTSPDLLLQENVSTDFMQLGWMVAWLIECEGEYHTRRWDTSHVAEKDKKKYHQVSENLKRNKFLIELIVEKKFNPRLLIHLPEGDATVEDVLKARSPTH